MLLHTLCELCHDSLHGLMLIFKCGKYLKFQHTCTDTHTLYIYIYIYIYSPFSKHFYFDVFQEKKKAQKAAEMKKKTEIKLSVEQERYLDNYSSSLCVACLM